MTAPRLPRPPAAVIFDMDGLLCDTETIYRDVMLAAARDFGRDMPLDVFLSMVGRPSAASRAITRDHFGADFPVDDYWAVIRTRVDARLAEGVALKAGVVELLDHLDALGLPRAICTSSSPSSVHSHLGPSGILPRFHEIVARGDYTDGKPHPAPYLTAARRLAVDPRHCLALEDSHNGVRSASAAGMMTVMVPDLLEATDDIRALCAHVAETLHDVRDMLRA